MYFIIYVQFCIFYICIFYCKSYLPSRLKRATNRACQRVSHNALIRNSQTHSVNESIQDYYWVVLETPVKNFTMGMLLTGPILNWFEFILVILLTYVIVLTKIVVCLQFWVITFVCLSLLIAASLIKLQINYLLLIPIKVLKMKNSWL